MLKFLSFILICISLSQVDLAQKKTGYKNGFVTGTNGVLAETGEY